jgi:hypothetical protein
MSGFKKKNLKWEILLLSVFHFSQAFMNLDHVKMDFQYSHISCFSLPLLHALELEGEKREFPLK